MKRNILQLFAHKLAHKKGRREGNVYLFCWLFLMEDSNNQKALYEQFYYICYYLFFIAIKSETVERILKKTVSPRKGD